MEIKKKHIIYVCPHLYSYGELPLQIFCLRNLYSESKYNITIITYPLQKNRVNRALYTIIMRGINVIQTTNHDLIWYSSNSKFSHVISDSDTDYAIFSNFDIRKRFLSKFQNQKPIYHFSLTEIEKQQGAKLRDSFGIPRTAPVVTLHVRESSWYGIHDNAGERNASIENYFKAIDYLIDQGFYIVRLGDRDMKQLSNMPNQFIDAPFHEAYTGLVDPYFISASQFLICTVSGPPTVSWGFGVPTLMTNAYYSPIVFKFAKDLFLFKKYYSHNLNRDLTFEEILLSDIIYYDYNEYSNANIELKENSAEVILEATKEMHAQTNGIYSLDEDVALFHQRLETILKKAKLLRPNLSHLPIFNMDSEGKCFLSTALLKENPLFFGHDCSQVKIDDTKEFWDAF